MERPGSGAGFGIASASISVAGLRCFDPVLESDFDFSSSSVLLNALADFSLPLPRIGTAASSASSHSVSLADPPVGTG